MSVAIMALAGSHSPAGACTTGGSGCLPGSGYTVTVGPWNCGGIVGSDICYYNATLSARAATTSSWGWGSASYDGAGDVYICIQGSIYFVGCAYNIARACYYTTCDDQDLVAFELSVRNQSGVTHTVHGRGMA
ncbi:hypothetical protein [Conexibacter sp. CPCC 206217]|uniref:hypothetical protein n=1 Tax=Conexibacter sp. CPCC 206217 TaxID=3064574 RepID=UPI002727B99F|nr:hypothetical protein [Conexibacter sp. CPCC 206217]MDO8214099.1 hypothetical protein [Conexibacter sp. CPCC 206217]